MARNTKRHKTRAIFLCEDNLKIENGNGGSILPGQPPFHNERKQRDFLKSTDGPGQ